MYQSIASLKKIKMVAGTILTPLDEHKKNNNNKKSINLIYLIFPWLENNSNLEGDNVTYHIHKDSYPCIHKASFS